MLCDVLVGSDSFRLAAATVAIKSQMNQNLCVLIIDSVSSVVERFMERSLWHPPGMG